MSTKKLVLLACVLASFGPGWAGAQETPPAAPASAEDSSPPGREEPAGPVITFHGYLTQGYAVSDGFQLIGISKRGTADYRAAALQMRADLADDDSFVIQLSHKRLGDSPLMKFHQDVELDWLFYEHRFGDSAVKVGRVQIPYGLYNEVRDVGTLLPFYRPSFDFYGESSFNTETVDGAVLSHSFKPWGSWSLDGDLYAGGFEFVGSDREYYLSKVNNARGFELWLQTPVPGLRIGAGGMRFNAQDTRHPDRASTPWMLYHLSLAGQFGRLTARAEYARFHVGPPATGATGTLHLGYAVTDRITVNGEIDAVALRTPAFDGKLDDDKVLGVNYAFHPNLVLKVEHHWNRGYRTEEPPPNIFGPPLSTRYWILSLSTGF
jgi:hypothetical protein